MLTNWAAFHVLAIDALATATPDDTNRPLAIATIAISAVAIVAGIMYALRRRDDGTPVDEGVLKALDSVEWYSNDVGKQLVAAKPADRRQIVDAAAPRIESAHATLVEHATMQDNTKWNELVHELTSTENAFDEFSQQPDADPGMIAQQQHVLDERLESFRKSLT